MCFYGCIWSQMAASMKPIRMPTPSHTYIITCQIPTLSVLCGFNTSRYVEQGSRETSSPLRQSPASERHQAANTQWLSPSPLKLSSPFAGWLHPGGQDSCRGSLGHSYHTSTVINIRVDFLKTSCLLVLLIKEFQTRKISWVELYRAFSLVSFNSRYGLWIWQVVFLGVCYHRGSQRADQVVYVVIITHGDGFCNSLSL